MRLQRLSAILLLFGCSAAASAAPPLLTIVPGGGTVVVSPAAARSEFVSRSLSDDKPLAHTFLLRNRTRAALTIERVAVSCDCVLAEVGEAGSLPVKVASGETVPVLVRLSMHRLIPGTVSKSAWIYLHGGSVDGLRLEMRGTVRDTAPSAVH